MPSTTDQSPLPTAGPTADEVARALRRGAVLARLAPSVHNTQPWSFVLTRDAVLVRADWSRRLDVLDLTGRQLLLSCGCAVFNARVALAASGVGAEVRRQFDGDRPAVLARVAADAGTPPDPDLAALDPWVTVRRTNRRWFAPEPVDPEVVARLQRVAAQEGAELREVTSEDDRLAVARWSQLADRLENEDPAYRAELRRWTTDDDLRSDGVPSFAVPGAGEARDDVPVRDFDARGTGTLPPVTASSMWQSMFLLGTRADNPAAWERAGEALQRVWLELTRAGYVASPLTQVVEQPLTRGNLREDLRLSTWPHVLLRVGHAAPTPATRRRRLSDLLVHA